MPQVMTLSEVCKVLQNIPGNGHPAVFRGLDGYAGKRPAQLNESFIKLGNENIER